MKTKPRWMKSVLATAGTVLPPLPVARAAETAQAAAAAKDAARA